MACLICGVALSKERLRRQPNAKTCSAKCAKTREKSEAPGTAIQLGIPQGIVGGLSELLVCADLLKQGYYVFRSVTDSCPCDLVVMYNDHLFRVEVRTLQTKSGAYNGSRQMNADIWAGVDILTNTIIYEPSLDAVFRFTDWRYYELR